MMAVIDYDGLMSELMEEDGEIEFLPLEEFGKQYFQSVKKGSTDDTIFRWKPKPLVTSLLDFSDKSLKKDAVAMNSHILCFMGDKKTNKPPEFHLYQIFKVVESAPEELHDEAFCQVIKQTNGNPNAPSCIRGWEVMTHLCGVITPSEQLLPYLKSWMKQNYKFEVFQGTKTLAQYSLLRLSQTMKMGTRKEVPTVDEMHAVQQLQPTPVPVQLVGYTEMINMAAETWTTVEELKAMVIRSVGIKEDSPFALFEVEEKSGYEAPLKRDERALDVMARWKRLNIEWKQNRSNGEMPSYKLVFKVRFYFDVSDDDVKAVELFYYQAVINVLNLKYTATKEEFIKLAALQAQELHGDYEEGTDKLAGRLEKFLPKVYHTGNGEEEKKVIYATWSQLAGYDPMAAKLGYLDNLKAWKTYGTVCFRVHPLNQDTEFPSDLILAINPRGVSLYSYDELLAGYGYDQILSHGYSQENVSIIVGNLIRPNNMIFRVEAIDDDDSKKKHAHNREEHLQMQQRKRQAPLFFHCRGRSQADLALEIDTLLQAYSARHKQATGN